jgi:hypothetical protein
MKLSLAGNTNQNSKYDINIGRINGCLDTVGSLSKYKFIVKNTKLQKD